MRKLGTFPHFPRPTPQCITFLIFISQKILLNIKDVEFYFRICCILVLFLFLWIINLQSTISDFWIFDFIFKYSDIGFLWSKINIFFIKIHLKLHLHTKYVWKNSNWGRLGLKSQKFYFLPFLGAQKFISYTIIQIHVSRSIFTVNWFF